MTVTTEKILEIFRQIDSIPRCSKKEQMIADWLCEYASVRGWDHSRDTWNNIVIRIPASSGYEDRPVLVLQGHMDMVCEKNRDSDHDFDRDPIITEIRDGWLRAKGTTLGADNGIALAMALAAGEDEDLVHPPLELLFTVDEETGLTGANNLRTDFIQGRILLNIDSEDEGVFTIGCAGGRDTRTEFPVKKVRTPDGTRGAVIRVTGLVGGHSGVDIHLQRANAIILLARFLSQIEDRIKLVSISGGTAHNAIPRESEALAVFYPEDLSELQSIGRKAAEMFSGDHFSREKGIRIEILPVDETPDSVFSDGSTTTLLRLLHTIPHGVSSMSNRIEGLVESSSNLARIRTEADSVYILTSQRSSSMNLLDLLTKRIESAALLSGASVSSGNGYPSWEPDFESELLKRCLSVYRGTFGREAAVEVIHAGLECGIIGSKYPGMEMISFGPTIKNPHSPDEALEIESLEKIQDLLQALFLSFCEN